MDRATAGRCSEYSGGRKRMEGVTRTWQKWMLDSRTPTLHNVVGGKDTVLVSVGILIIGSLYWEEDRQEWRDSRLRMGDAIDVRAPIRYGKISETRGNTYTMVFSRSCPPGQAKVVPCQNIVRTAEDLVLEAEHLWAAERRATRNGRISANWGSVTLLPNPHGQTSVEILNCWASRAHCARDYGNIQQAPGEGVLVDDRGILQITWPTLIADNSPVVLDLLPATATQPDLTRDTPWYPTPQMTADRWREDTNNNIRYFRNNVRDGICTFEDDAIATALNTQR